MKDLQKVIALGLILMLAGLCVGCRQNTAPTTYPTYPSLNQNPILSKPAVTGQNTLIATPVVVSCFGEVAVLAQSPVGQWEGKDLVATPKDISRGGRIGGKDGLDREMIIKKVVIVSELVPLSTREWFRDMPDLAEIQGLHLVRTDRVTDMSYMFSGCCRIEALNISEWNVSRVKNMTGMFDGCDALNRLPNWYVPPEETE